MEENKSYAYESMIAYLDDRNYDLSEVVNKKLPDMLIRDLITSEEFDELVLYAQEHSKPTYDTELRIKNLETQIDALNEVITDLQRRATILEGEEPEVPEKDEYPLWKQPTHAGDAYYNGDKMTYTDGFKYECIAPEGYAVTYGPDVLPQYWRKME